MKSVAIIFLVAISIVSGHVSARDPAAEIFAATKLGEQLDDARESCEASELAGDIEGIAAANPSMFYEIDSRSAHWPDARAAYLHYAASTCVPQDIQSYANLSASFYRGALTEDEISAVLKFYESEVGKKFAQVSLRLSSAMNKKMYEESRNVREEGVKTFESKMKEISTRPGPNKKEGL